MKRICLVAILLLNACTHHSALDECRKEPAKCAAIDMDDSEAKSGYAIGCNAKDANSCYRLGQLQETKAGDANESIKAYELSCTYGNNDGCEDAKDLRAKLCYFDKKTDFCKGEPRANIESSYF